MLVVVAVLMGLTALAATLAPRDPSPRGSGAPSVPSPARTPTAPTPGPEATATPAPEHVETVNAAISADEGAKRPRVTADVGDIVNITVEGDVIDAVSVEGLTDHATLDPESPAVLELFADTPGRYPITLLEAERRIGTLDVKEP
jgi:hypothetical protein